MRREKCGRIAVATAATGLSRALATFVAFQLIATIFLTAELALAQVVVAEEFPARYRGRYLGTFGQTATQSFHETKNVICGEGGALLLNDESLIERAEILREKGTNRSRYFRGVVDKYTWVGVGSSYLMSDILAAFLCAQLESSAGIQAARRRIWETYHRELAGWAAGQNVRLPYVPVHCEHPYHMYYLMMPSLEARTTLIQHLKQRSILSVFHYIPLHLSEMGQSFGGHAGQCPHTEHAGECLLRLPFYNDLSESEQAEVVEAVLQFKCCDAVGR